MARNLIPILILALSAALLQACEPAGEAGEPPAVETASSDRPVVEIVTSEYAFEAPGEFPSGWTTLRLTNEGEQTHFLLLWLLPEGRTFEEFSSEIAVPFNEMYADYRAGILEQEEFLTQLGEALPEWFGELQRKGGVGYVAPGRSVQTTVLLEPGDYVMECYVRAPDPEVKFHNALGMLRPLIVSSESTGAEPPEADATVTLSNYEIALDGELGAGENTVRVDVTEEPEGGLLGHNVQVVRLEGEASAEEVATWLDWVDHLQPPAPAEFVGGSGQMQAGATSYFTVDLEPGRYALVSEGYGPQGMLRELVIE